MLCQNPSFDIDSDFRLNFLRERFDNVKIEYVDSYRGCSNIQISDNPSREEYLDEAWAKKLFQELKATAIVFDYIIDSGQFVTGPLLKAARQLNIPAIGVPPGLPVFSEGYLPDIDFFKKEVKTELDYNIVPHQIDADYRVRHGFRPERVQILGSARFCKEWRDVINNIVPPDKLSEKGLKGKLKVVYMERGADLHRKYKEVIEDTIKKISRLDIIHLIIKPHTRARKLHFSDTTEFAEITDEANSINLIKWADVVIGTNSSILIEALMQDKILLYPKYFHDDQMVFHDMGACWSVNNYKNLESALIKISTGNFAKPYSTENVNSLVKKIVYGGRKDRDVLADYVRVIQDLGNNRTSHKIHDKTATNEI